MNKRITNVAMIVLTLGLIGLFSASLYVRLDHVRQDKVIHRLDKQKDRAQEAYEAKRSRLESDYLNQVAKKGKGASKQIAINNNAYRNLYTISNKFFKGYYNWDSTKSFNGRAQAVADYAMDTVLKNDQLFKPDDGKTVDALNLKSTFNLADVRVTNADDKTERGLAVVHYTQENMTSSGTGTAVYEITFDRQQAKLTNVTLLQQSTDD